MIDSCVHYQWDSQMEVFEYLSAGSREYYGRPGLLPGGRGMASLLPPISYHPPGGRWLPQPGGPEAVSPATSPLSLVSEYLEPAQVERAVLVFADASRATCLPNGPFALELAQAINRWTSERWLSGQDARLYGSILAPLQLPEEAAAEIRRAAADPRMAAIIVSGNPLGRPFGHNIYAPIHAAAAELGLPIVVVAGGDLPPNTPSHPTAGGYPSTFSEFYLLRAQALMTHLVSFIAGGVLERYRDLKVVMLGGGAGWVAPFVGRANEAALAYAPWEAPWLRRAVPEQVRDQVRFCTYTSGPMLAGGAEAEIALEFQDSLVFGSGYPCWDSDDAAELARSIPPQARSGIFRETALDSYRWPN